jgi:hypothetical protein
VRAERDGVSAGRVADAVSELDALSPGIGIVRQDRLGIEGAGARHGEAQRELARGRVDAGGACAARGEFSRQRQPRLQVGDLGRRAISRTISAQTGVRPVESRVAYFARPASSVWQVR